LSYSNAVFHPNEGSMTVQEGGGADNQSSASQSGRPQTERHQPEEQSVGATKIWASATRAAHDEQLLTEQEVFSQQRFDSSGFEVEYRQSAEQVDKEEENVLHRGDHGIRRLTCQAAVNRPMTVG
jgi:hypothetical protein